MAENKDEIILIKPIFDEIEPISSSDNGLDITTKRNKYPVRMWLVKNDHLGFYIPYNFKGVIRKYYPDFMIRLVNGKYLILETKGIDSQQNQTKREFLNE